jgi:nitrate reductase NapE component
MDQPTDVNKVKALLRRDKTATVMLGLALFLIFFMLVATGVVARVGFSRAWLLEIVLGLTAAFAVAGIVLGLARSLKGARAGKNRTA